MRNSSRLFPTGLLAFACILALISCGEDENPTANTGARVTGTVTVPASASNMDFQVFVDSDTDFLNGVIKTCSNNCMGNTSAPYTLNDVPSGLYYVYAIVRVNSLNGMPLVSGDLIGYHNGTGISPPADASASVASTGTFTFNLSLAVKP